MAQRHTLFISIQVLLVWNERKCHGGCSLGKILPTSMVPAHTNLLAREQRKCTFVVAH